MTPTPFLEILDPLLLLSLLSSAESSLEIIVFKIYLSGKQVECPTVWIQIMPDILAGSGFRLLTKFSRQIFNVVGKNENHNMTSFAFEKNSTTLNLRIGVFS